MASTVLAQETITQQGYRLLQEMSQVRASLQCINGRCAQGCDGGSDTVDQANHAVELATDRALCHLYQEKLKQLERAWTRFCTGQYGICESCGDQIDPARLNLVPHTALCVRCQQESGSTIRRANHRVDCSRTRR